MLLARNLGNHRMAASSDQDRLGGHRRLSAGNPDRVVILQRGARRQHGYARLVQQTRVDAAEAVNLAPHIPNQRCPIQ